jgi:hypothetical protein
VTGVAVSAVRVNGLLTLIKGYWGGSCVDGAGRRIEPVATTISAAAMQALAAYGGPPRAGAGAGGPYPAGEAKRETVRHGAGVSVELSADARASLIAVQSAASWPGLSAGPAAAAGAAGTSGAYELPGSRLNLSI